MTTFIIILVCDSLNWMQISHDFGLWDIKFDAALILSPHPGTLHWTRPLVVVAPSCHTFSSALKSCDIIQELFISHENKMWDISAIYDLVWGYRCIHVLTRLFLLSRRLSLSFLSMLDLKVSPSCFSWHKSLGWRSSSRWSSMFSFLLMSSPYPDFPFFLAFAQAILATALTL